MTATEIPVDLSGITPVGMTAQAGIAGAVIAELAQEKRGLPNWQAFHYEQINPHEFEVTGGVLDPSLSGMRKFSGPHETVILQASAILHALQMRIAAELPSAPKPAENKPLTAAPAATLSEQPLMPAQPVYGSEVAHLPYLQVTLALPQQPEARARLLAQLATGTVFDGATVVASALLPVYPRS